jgi:hypothetical protein
MNNQLSLPLGRKLRDTGMGYAERNAKFMAEDVRFASQGLIENPPSQRAWGGVFARAAKKEIIHNNDDEYKPVKNANAHCTPAAVWKSLIYQYKKAL